MTSQGTAHGRFQRAIHRGNVQAAETAAREMGGLSLADALALCELLAKADPARYERAARRWLERVSSDDSGAQCGHVRSGRRPIRQPNDRMEESCMKRFAWPLGGNSGAPRRAART